MNTIGSLFSGIGLLELGLERSRLGKTVWQIENDNWCRTVLARHWPEATRFNDVKTATDLPRTDILCGGFPCQPFSLAGERKAQADERHLWPEYARIIREVEPKIVIAENVLGLRTSGLRDVLADLAALGFDVEWTCLSASYLGAPHIRRRIFIVATHPDRVCIREQPGWLSRACESARQAVDRRVSANHACIGREIGGGVHGSGKEPEIGCVPSHSDRVRRLESALSFATQRGWAEHCGWPLDTAALMDDGCSEGLARRTVKLNLTKKRKALGNAVVVRCAEVVGRALVDAIV